MSDGKWLLIAAAIGLSLAALLILADLRDGLDLDIMSYFNELVDECQTAHPDWDRSTCEGIVRKDVWVGMTEEMLIASLGEPRQIDQPRANRPEYEEWTYFTTQYGQERMMLIDGLLVDWDQEPCTSCAAKPPRE